KTQWRCGVDAAFLRSEGLDPQLPERWQSAPLPARGATPRGHHQGGAAHRHSACRDPRRVVRAAGEAHAERCRLETAVSAMGGRPRRANRAADAAARPARRLHRLRLPLDRRVSAAQSLRRAGGPRRRPAFTRSCLSRITPRPARSAYQGVMTPLEQRYATRNVPRYTSYPTAPHFHAGVTGEIYGEWLATLDPAIDLSLYLHVPYCRVIC